MRAASTSAASPLSQIVFRPVKDCNPAGDDNQSTETRARGGNHE